ncbi:Vitamin K-dependent gamma-carboxylase [Gimesia alba]|uniref:Vitamin K-dependent gamma-carboxylase n=1 Tax=Gimesia alba TaxID=2527973 RepID=A0A517RNB2_9PLAN|nr:HTTM domain-containing protein [Gimesia alba]QDT45359.1 Vitamin K-dependent gamma-carboxylase [Gimesia alba]
MDAKEVVPTLTHSIRDRFQRFFFTEEVPYGLAIVRMLVPMVLLGTVCTRWPYSRELFSADGAPAPLAEIFRYYDFLPILPGTVVVGLFAALAFFLFCSCIGWMTRFSLIASVTLYTYFCFMDCISMATKYSVISTHVLFLLSLSRCGSIWSVDSWLKGKREKKTLPLYTKHELPRSEIWPQRLMQILIALVYFGAAITKLHTPGYLEGDQISYWAMSRYNNPHPLGEFLTMYPIMLSVMSYVAIVWEIAFVFVVWRKWGRILGLGLGAAFHIGTLFSLGLYIFPMVSISIYFCFLTESDVQWISAQFRRLVRRAGWLKQTAASLGAAIEKYRPQPVAGWKSPTAWVTGIVAVLVLSIYVEHQQDIYGLRRPEGRMTLHEVDPELMAEMLAPEQTMKQKDKFLSVDTGTQMVGGWLTNRKSEFMIGEMILVQCCLNPPHEDIWIDCHFCEEDGRIVHRSGQIVLRENLRSAFQVYTPESLEPGNYYVSIKSKGKEVLRRSVTLLPKLSAVAN